MRARGPKSPTPTRGPKSLTRTRGPKPRPEPHARRRPNPHKDGNRSSLRFRIAEGPIARQSAPPDRGFRTRAALLAAASVGQPADHVTDVSLANPALPGNKS